MFEGEWETEWKLLLYLRLALQGLELMVLRMEWASEHGHYHGGLHGDHNGEEDGNDRVGFGVRIEGLGFDV